VFGGGVGDMHIGTLKKVWIEFRIKRKALLCHAKSKDFFLKFGRRI
jgi:hypothetical protein